MRNSEPGKKSSVADVLFNPAGNTPTGNDEVSRGDIDHEHETLCLLLRHILHTEMAHRSLLAEKALLEDFHRQLVSHHQTEDTLLRTLKPGNWQTHVELHAELISIVGDILKKVSRDSYLDYSAVEGLLVLLERHVSTLDATLLARIEGQ